MAERSRIGFLLLFGFLWRLLSIEKAARMGGHFNRATLDSHNLKNVAVQDGAPPEPPRRPET